MNTQHASPAVPVGLSTKLGLTVSAIGGILAALSVILAGDVTDETVAALAAALVPLYTVIAGRMDQAAAASMAPAHTEFLELDGAPAGRVAYTDEVGAAHERALAALREGAALVTAITDRDRGPVPQDSATLEPSADR